jgi:hypothetical protein
MGGRADAYYPNIAFALRYSSDALHNPNGADLDVV